MADAKFTHMDSSSADATVPVQQCNCDAEDENINIVRSKKPTTLQLNLDNFDEDQIIQENCPYVLTSPRSLQACRIQGVRVSQKTSLNTIFCYPRVYEVYRMGIQFALLLLAWS
jgi:hypothetical protein